MEKLIERYRKIKDKMHSRLMSGFVSAYLDTSGETGQSFAENKKERFTLNIELLSVLAQLCSYDKQTYCDELQSELKNVLHEIRIYSYNYEKESDRAEFVVSVLMIFLGSDMQYIYPYLPDEYCGGVSFRCDGYLAGYAAHTAEQFSKEGNTDMAQKLTDNLINLSDRYCIGEERGTFLGIVDLLLAEYLIEAMPEKAADVFVKYKNELTEYLDLNTGDKLFVLAQDIGMEEPQKAEPIFEGILANRRLAFDKTSIFCWAAEMKMVLCRLIGHCNDDNCDSLAGLIRQALVGNITDTEGIEEAVLLGETMVYSRILLRSALTIFRLSEYTDILDCYYDYCMEVDYENEDVSKYFAYEYMAAYHTERGEYLQAEQYYQKMRQYSEGDRTKASNALLADMRMVLMYYLTNDDRCVPMCEKVYENLYHNFDEMMSIDDNVKMYTKYFVAAFTECISVRHEKEEYYEKLYELVVKYDILPDTIEKREDAYIAITWFLLLVYTERMEENGYKAFFDDVKKIEEFNKDRKDPYIARMINNWYGMLYTVENTDEALKYLTESYENSKSEGNYLDVAQRAQMAGLIFRLYMQKNDIDSALYYKEEELRVCSENLALALRYLDEGKLLDMISETMVVFEALYYYASKAGRENLYDYVLRYKALKSYVIQVRNELTKQYTDDKGLLSQIHQIKERIASIQTNNTFFSDTQSTELLEKRLEVLEAQFETQFPAIDISPGMQSEDLLPRLENGQAVIEYVHHSKVYDHIERAQEMEDDELEELFAETYEYEAYIIRNIDGRLVIKKESLGNFIDAGEQIYELLDCLIYNDNSDKEAAERRLTVAKVNLYKTIVEPLIKHLDGVDELIIAPIDDICAVPFDILGRNGKEYLIDSYNIRYIECGRDLMRNHTDTTGTDALLIGNPVYDFENILDKQSGARVFATQLAPLPFSGVEVERIAKRLGGRAYTGRYANKNLLMNASGYRYIHISTHGDFDYEHEKNPIYSSCMFFSGAQNWLDTGREDPECGNGVITADEVSRLNLHGTELVVLSSCHSGALSVDAVNGATGLRSSFKAAGARYVVMSQWELYDLATAIMMDKFYEYLETMPVQKALRSAKLYLREVTVGKLEYDGWLDSTNIMDMEIAGQINKIRQSSINSTPFSDARYWGAMACMEC